MMRSPCSLVMVSIACLASCWLAPVSYGLEMAIPAQPLALALRRFAQGSGLQLVYVSQVAHGQHSAGSAAGLSNVVTLEQLLRGTGLRHEFVNERTVLILGAAHPARTAANPQQNAGRPPPAKDSAVLEEVIVTAERRSADMQKTALSIVTFSGQQLEQQARQNLSAVLQPVAGVVMQGDVGRFNVAIRGIGTNTPPNAAETTVALNTDGIYNDTQVSTAANFFDIDRVELLRGPQGTLYGRNAAAGVVNIISNDPARYFDASASLELGNYQLQQVAGVLNVPVSAAWSGRVAVNALSHAGYLSNGQNDQDSRAARLKLLYQPDEQLRVLLSAAAERMDGSTGTVAAFDAQPTHPWLDADSTPNASRTSNQSLSMQLNYDLGFAQLTALPAYQYRTTRQSFHSSGNRLNQTNSNLRQRSLEVRLSEPVGASLNWVAGVFAYDSAGILYFNSGPSSYSIKSSAAFAQVTLPLGNEWRGIAGVRLTLDSKSRSRSGNQYMDRWRNIDYKLGIERDIRAQSLAYLQVATGYRPGGVYEPQPGSYRSYDPEHLLSYELGMKSRWLNDRLQLNADAFLYDYRHFQATGIQNINGALVFAYQNAPGANTAGIELETVFLPGARDRLDFSLAYLTAQFKQGFVNNGVDYSGSTLENTPRWSGSAKYEHSWRVVRGELTASTEVIGKTAYYLVYSQQSHSRQPSYCLVNLAGNYLSSDGRWQFTGWVRNVGNYAVRTAAITTPASGDFLVISPPRTYGAGATFHY